MQSKQQHPVFNGKYEITKSLGEGNTSKVYLARSVDNHSNNVAIKILKDEFLKRDNDSILSVHNEITILKNLNHSGIIRMIDYGDAGQVLKPSGRVIDNLVFIVMEFVQGGLLFDLCQTMGAMGEDAGRFFLMQMVEAIIDRDNMLDLGEPCRKVIKSYAVGFNTVVRKAKNAVGLYTFSHCQ